MGIAGAGNSGTRAGGAIRAPLAAKFGWQTAPWPHRLR